MTFTRVCKRVVYSLIPAVVLFGTLEGVCRIWEHYDEPPGILAGKKEKLPPKLEGEFRVLFFGGSTVFGSPEPSVGIVAQLEYALKKVNPERTIRFFNYARPGNASSGVVREMSEVVKESDADVMVVLTAHNEYMERTDVTEEDLARLAAIREQMYRSALVRRAQRLYFRYYLARRPDVIEREF